MPTADRDEHFEVALTQEEINALIGALNVSGKDEEKMLKRIASDIGAGPEQAEVVLGEVYQKLFEFYLHPDFFNEEEETED